MQTQDLDQVRYPIGPFTRKEVYSAEDLQTMIDIIEQAPARYAALVQTLSKDDLQKCYRPGSYNVIQLIHHVADIQLLHFFRMKKALTESDYDTITLIDMDAWSRTPEAMDAPAEYSLTMLQGITARFVYLLRTLTDDQLKISYYHPVRKFSMTQAHAINMSAWHLQHHLAHIEIATGRR